MKKTKTLCALKVLLLAFLAAPVTQLSSCVRDRAVTLSDLETMDDADATQYADPTAETDAVTGTETAPATASATGAATGDMADGTTDAATAVPSAGDSGALTAPSSAPASAPPTVYVCGKVVSPGVYELKQGARVSDALSAAGGFTEEADKSRINLAGFVYDGEMIYFPAGDEEIPPQAFNPEGPQAAGTQATGPQAAGNHASSPGAQTSPTATQTPGDLVNINTAGTAELTSLPGIGNTRAEAIIKYRDQNGPFKSPSDIKSVPGIGESLYSGIEELICAN